jgi:hypothetical protein
VTDERFKENQSADLEHARFQRKLFEDSSWFRYGLLNYCTPGKSVVPWRFTARLTMRFNWMLIKPHPNFIGCGLQSGFGMHPKVVKMESTPNSDSPIIIA